MSSKEGITHEKHMGSKDSGGAGGLGESKDRGKNHEHVEISSLCMRLLALTTILQVVWLDLSSCLELEEVGGV